MSEVQRRWENPVGSPFIIIAFILTAAVSISSCGPSGKKAEQQVRAVAMETASEGALDTGDSEKPDASLPTGEPLTLPAVIPPQHTAAAPRADMPQDPGKQPGVSQNTTVMQVVNCKEWISLRTMPSTSADTIARIPLGEEVIWAGLAENGFYHVIYQGKSGYALAEYLVLIQ